MGINSAFTPRPILQHHSDDRQVVDLQRSLSLPIEQLQQLQPLVGVYFSTIADTTGTQVPIVFNPLGVVVIKHNLAHPYVGWIIARIRNVTGNNPWVREGTQDSELDATQVTLVNPQATVTFTADVWVY